MGCVERGGRSPEDWRLQRALHGGDVGGRVQQGRFGEHVEGVHEGSEGFQPLVCTQMRGRKYEPSARMLAEPSESLWGKGSALSPLIHAHVYVFIPFLTKECLCALSQTGANPTAQSCYPRTGGCWQKSS